MNERDAAAVPRLVAKLGRDLEALDEPIRQWEEARERAFSTAFDRKDGPLGALMGRLPQAAAAAAGVGTGPVERVFAVFDEICDLYARSDPGTCAALREIVHEHKARGLLPGYLSHCARVLEQGGKQEWLERGLAAASIDDQRHDYRDWLMSLGDLYLSAFLRGLHPGPALKRMAERSNDLKPRGGPTPTRAALERFEESAYFATSILPRLR